MGIAMDQDALKALATELAKGIKTEKDLGDLTQQRVKLTVETSLRWRLCCLRVSHECAPVDEQ